MKRRITILVKTTLVIGLIFSLLSGMEGKPLRAAEPIKIGSIVSITGVRGFMGTPQKEAIEIVAEDVNRKGGVLGRPIEIYFEDD